MELSREQCYSIKGLAILLIMIHNFTDFLLSIECNEMVYEQKNTDVFLENLFSSNWFGYIFSFAGWIGVAAFFFLSGYGLTKKYNGSKTFNSGSYIKNHLIKLWILLVPVYLLYISVFTTDFITAIAHITFTINILRYVDNHFILDPGVYWFFGAIFQFYLLFIFMRKLDNRWLWCLCIVFLVFHYYLLYLNTAIMSCMRHNFIGWGTAFTLGIIAAKTQLSIPKQYNRIVCAISFITLCFCLVIKWLTPFTEVFTIIFFITLSKMLTKKWICFIGVISPSIFVLHPTIRRVIYCLYFAPEHAYLLTLIFIAIVIPLSWLHHVILKKVNRLLFSKQS